MPGASSSKASDHSAPWVDVRWAAERDGAAHLRATVAAVVGEDPGLVRHLCPECGSIEHGAPSVDAEVLVSLAYAPPLVVAAVSSAGPVGVDVERRESLLRADLSGIARHRDEPAWTPETWVRKEALLKATGRGLAVDPRTIRLDGTTVVEGPRPSWLVDLELPEGYVGAVAVLSPQRPEVRAAPLRTATSGTGRGAPLR